MIIKLFEDFNDVNEIVSDVKDMCLELNDMYIRVECHHNPEIKKMDGIRREYILFGLEKELSDDDMESLFSINDEVKWSDIDDVIYRVLDYMKDCGWKPSYVIVDSESTNIENRDATEYLKNRFRFGTFGGEISPVFSGLQIDFVRI